MTRRNSVSNLWGSIDTIKKKGIDWVKDLGSQNAEDMLKIIEWNEKNASALPLYALCILNDSRPEHPFHENVGLYLSDDSSSELALARQICFPMRRTKPMGILLNTALHSLLKSAPSPKGMGTD